MGPPPLLALPAVLDQLLLVQVGAPAWSVGDDHVAIDDPWLIGDLADVYQLNMAPHNYYSHLSSFMSASLCAVLPNVHIMEIDVDDVPWKDDLVTVQPQIESGDMIVPSGPGWGTDLNWERALEHPWRDKKSRF